MASVRLENTGIVCPARKAGGGGVQKCCGEIPSEGPGWKGIADLLMVLTLPCCPAASQSQPSVQTMPQQ